MAVLLIFHNIMRNIYIYIIATIAIYLLEAFCKRDMLSRKSDKARHRAEPGDGQNLVNLRHQNRILAGL